MVSNRRRCAPRYGIYTLGDLEDNLQVLEKSRHTERHIDGHSGSVLSKEEVKDITTQILEGVKIMHAEGFAHRDLKPQVRFFMAPKLFLVSISSMFSTLCVLWKPFF
jgi:serine/threonine protein kinase